MKNRFLPIALVALASALLADAQLSAAQSQPTPTKPTSPAVKPMPTPVKKSGPPKTVDVKTQTPASNVKPEPTVSELITQGKALYRSARFKAALAKFEAALKLDPDHDETLGLAAITTFRLDNQAQAREYFQRRAELMNQKDSVKAYSYYRIALTHWREVHDLVAKFGDIKDGVVIVTVPDRYELDVKYGIDNGLDYADRALSLTHNFPEAYNIKNLLHAEAALVETNQSKAGEHRQQAAENLTHAIELDAPTTSVASTGSSKETTDFSRPTVRIGEFARTKDAEAKLEDEMMKLIEGGRPIKRVQPAFPGVSAPKPSGDQSDSGSVSAISGGATSESGASSLGSGRGALTAAYVAGRVKVEVLVSTAGDVVFAHVVDGRPELSGAAVMAARSWKFEPAMFNGKPVQLSGVITFDLRPR